MLRGDKRRRLLKSCYTPPIQARQKFLRPQPHRLRLLQVLITKNTGHCRRSDFTRFLYLPKSTRPSIRHLASRKPIQRPMITISTTYLPHQRPNPTTMTTLRQNDQRWKPSSMKQRRFDVSTKSVAEKVLQRQWQQWMPEWPCPLFHPRQPSQSLQRFRYRGQEPPFPERQPQAASIRHPRSTPQLHDHNYLICRPYLKVNVPRSAAPQASFHPPSTKAEAPRSRKPATTTSSNRTRIL